MMTLSARMLLLCSLFLFVACGSDDDEEMPTPNPPSGGNCVTQSITYESHIQALVNANCAISGCHVAGTGRVNFTSFAGLKSVADDGRLRQKVLVEKSMPPNGSLSQCELDQIDAWLKDGAPEN